MVLTELGSSITAALRKLNTPHAIDQDLVAEVMKDVTRALLTADVSASAIKQMRDACTTALQLDELPGGVNKTRLIQQTIFTQLVKMLDPGVAPFKPKKGQPNVIMFVGLQGAGKTTTIAKYARHYKLKGWKTCMICADTFRAGAFDQLKQNAARVRVPFYGSYTEPDPVKIAREGVEQFKEEGMEIIIVDTSGRHMQESALFDEMKEVAAAVQPDDVVFVMDSTIGQAARAQAEAFKGAVAVGSVILTKLDGGAKGGGALSAVAATRSPIIFTGSGEHFDDLDAFEAEGFVRRLLGMGDLKGLITTFQDRISVEKQEEMLSHLKEGVFTLRDMRDQFQNILSLGPLSKVMSMLPSAMTQFMAQGADEQGGNRMKRFLYMLDSMTDAELDGVVQLNESRIRRVAQGSGTSVPEVEMMLDCHKKFGKMLGGMGKAGLMNGDAKLAQEAQRNPGAVMQKLAKAMPKNMLRNMGGPQSMMNLFQQVSKMDMSQMQDMLGGMGGMGGLPGMGGGGMPDMAQMAQMAQAAGLGGGRGAGPRVVVRGKGRR